MKDTALHWVKDGLFNKLGGLIRYPYGEKKRVTPPPYIILYNPSEVDFRSECKKQNKREFRRESRLSA